MVFTIRSDVSYTFNGNTGRGTETDHDGYGTIWIIHPNDISKTVSWIPPCGTEIDTSGSSTEYDYTIFNTDENIIVKAQKRR